MYLTHHYLIDVVGSSCLAIAFFYLFLPNDLKGPLATASPTDALANSATHRNGHSSRRSKYEIYDLEEPHLEDNGLSYELSSDAASDKEEPMDITYRSPAPGTSMNGAGSMETPTSGMPLIYRSTKQSCRSHKHTASITSLIRIEPASKTGGAQSAQAHLYSRPRQHA